MWAARCSSGVRIPNLLSRQLSAFSRRVHSSNPFPYPSQPNPNPHQIFHLPQKASQSDIKTRFPDYDLVRIYHPDSAIVRSLALPSKVAHARFQSINKAYDHLRGKTPLSSTGAAKTRSDPFTTKRARHAQARHAALQTGKDDRWKDRVILVAVLVTLCLGVAQTASTRQQAITELSNRSRLAGLTASPSRNRALRTIEEDKLAAPEDTP